MGELACSRCHKPVRPGASARPLGRVDERCREPLAPGLGRAGARSAQALAPERSVLSVPLQQYLPRWLRATDSTETRQAAGRPGLSGTLRRMSAGNHTFASGTRAKTQYSSLRRELHRNQRADCKQTTKIHIARRVPRERLVGSCLRNRPWRPRRGAHKLQMIRWSHQARESTVRSCRTQQARSRLPADVSTVPCSRCG